MAIGEHIFAISRQISANLMALIPLVDEGVSVEGEKGQVTGDVYVPPSRDPPATPLAGRHFHGDDKEVFVPDRYNDPRHTFDALERVEFYNQLKEKYPHLLTPLTRRLIRVAELMEYFVGLDPDKFSFGRVRERNEIRTMFRELKRLTREIVTMYTRQEILPDFAVSKMVTSAYKGKDAVAVLLDFDFTSVNHFDDTDSLGDELALAIGDSLWDVLRSEEAVKVLGQNEEVKRVVRVRYPQRSAFLIVGNSKKIVSPTGVKYEDKVVPFLNDRYRDIEANIYERLKAAQREGRIAKEIDLDVFRLKAIAYSSPIALEHFEDDLKRRKIGESVVVEHIFNELKRLSSKAAFIKESNRSGAVASAERIAATLVQGGFVVYGPEVLLDIGAASLASLKEFVDNGRGFIPLGTFGPGLLEKDPDIKKGLTWRDYKHTAGDITRDESYGNGGWLEVVRTDLGRFLTFPTQATRNGSFKEFKEKVSSLGRLLLHAGEETRRNDRAPHFMNADKVWKNGHVETNDFFVEQLGLMQAELSKKHGRDVRLNLFFTVEVDDGRAYTMRYPINDHVDGNFQMIGWKVFTTYSDKGGFPIVGGALGDQMWFGAALEKKDGTSFIPEQILGAIQDSIKAHFVERGEIFQVHAKIEMPDGTVERVPVWLLQGQAVASTVHPVGSTMARKPVTVTVCFTEMPELAAPDAAAQINRKRHLMLSYIGKLKKQNGWRKMGLGKLPPDYVNGDAGGAKAPQDMEPGAIKLYDPLEMLEGGVVKERGWTGSDGGAYLSGNSAERPAVFDERILREAKRARRALNRARYEIERAKK